MSGGVDSSTAAALLAQNNSFAAGSENVVGLTMQLWNQRRLPSLLSAESEGPEGRGRCCSLDDVYDARRVANFLGLPYYLVNFERRFEDRVVRPFVESYLRGETPIPCSACNTEIKFAQFVETARQIGADRIATGHYARIRRDEAAGRYRLYAGVDSGRDQSYFLFGLTQDQLARALFPLGELTKQEVRAIARDRKLPVAEKPDSQEICFVASGNYKQFIDAYLEEQGPASRPVAQDARDNELSKGEIVSSNGQVLGEHNGLHHFTVGQRKGLGFATGEPLYVIALEPARNRVIVGKDPELFHRRMLVREVNWICAANEGETLDARVKIRNRHVAAPALIEALTGNEAAVEFREPQRAITPGQAAVFYRDEEVLGGGCISAVLDGPAI